jgi:hypothetical protein
VFARSRKSRQPTSSDLGVSQHTFRSPVRPKGACLAELLVVMEDGVGLDTRTCRSALMHAGAARSSRASIPFPVTEDPQCDNMDPLSCSPRPAPPRRCLCSEMDMSCRGDQSRGILGEPEHEEEKESQ